MNVVISVPVYAHLYLNDTYNLILMYKIFTFNFILMHSFVVVFSWPVDRKLNFGEVRSETSLVRSSQANNIVSWQEYFPLLKNKEFTCARCWQHIFKMLILGWLNNGKTQSSESAASLEEVIVEMTQCQ